MDALLLSSGITEYPRKLTEKGVYDLAFAPPEEFAKRVFILQIHDLSIQSTQLGMRDYRKQTNAQFDISDGIGKMTVRVQPHVMDQIDLYDLRLKDRCIICILGESLYKFQLPDGRTGLVLNDCPRLIIQQIIKIGDPVSIIEACNSNKYSNMSEKYKPNYFDLQKTSVMNEWFAVSMQCKSLRLQDCYQEYDSDMFHN